MRPRYLHYCIFVRNLELHHTDFDKNSITVKKDRSVERKLRRNAYDHNEC